MGRGRATPQSNRCRSQSSNWDKDLIGAHDLRDMNDMDSDSDHLRPMDATAATLPAPSLHAIPALWVSSRRRHHRGRSRRRSTSETYQNGHLGRPLSGFRALPIHHVPLAEQLRAATTVAAAAVASPAASPATTAAAAAAIAAGRPLNQRLRITTPDGPRGSGWVRGQAADVQWEALDPSVQCVRIDVCNVAWTVPTTIAHCVANDGTFHWRRVYWGMPIAEGYYVNIYDVTAPKDPSESVLLAQSERFAVIK
ncbi:unnamed protein product [Hyaloperonospora brassicae]|uniref:Uncharacterized protein n=1 Tax=Hyaloperonospora brassicae TaxID=162125 RepID=A0AAV0UDH1_HYABA|nr:unnamed protein product [Hyaloperonospora brassicae]